MTDDIAVEEDSAIATLTRIKPPPFYRVDLLNDNFTTMDFVVMILQKIFKHNLEDAQRIMLQIHNDGRGTCGVYTLDIAQTKVAQVNDLAQKANFPLQCVIEKEKE